MSKDISIGSWAYTIGPTRNRPSISRRCATSSKSLASTAWS